ncbi:MAG: hypothetical protein HKN52_12405, partial [Eudoraea sp.]|nr:hypothetical protein [Eudoraea sp.]
MKKIEVIRRFGYLVLFVFLLGVVGCSKSSDDPDDVQTVEEPDTPDPVVIDPNRPWNLIWEDDFDTDLSLWSSWESGAYNNEVQYYRPEQLEL